MVDALGNPIDGKGPLPGKAKRDVHGEPPHPLSRRPIEDIFQTGYKSIDGLLTIGKGQRMGIFAGSGLGKSVLIGEMAKQAQADVNVIALVGERGREVGDFINQVLGPEGLKKSVVIVATSDRPAVERQLAAFSAHAYAEHFRDTGMDVLLVMDSLTRFCQAGRDIGLANGEPPAIRGFPPSAFAPLAGLLERSGTGPTGSVTALYTVLVDGDDENDPVADNVRGILDGHIFLSRSLAAQGVYPAIDLGLSVSRLMQDLVDDDIFQLAQQAREVYGTYNRVRDLGKIGAYKAGSDPSVDKAIATFHIVTILKQAIGEHHNRDASLQLLREVVGA